MRAKIIFTTSLLFPFALTFIYVWFTSTDLVFRDDMYLIKGGPIENYLKGTLTFADLWRPTDFTRILGYNLLLILNIKFFSMNSKLLALLVPFFMMASAILIYSEYRKTLVARSREFIALTFVALSLIIFSVIQWEALVFGNVLTYQAATPFFIASFISIELFILQGTRKYLLAAFIINAMAVLVFSGRLCLVFVPTLGTTILCYLIVNYSRLRRELWVRVLQIIAFLSFIIFLYIFRMQYNEYSDSSYLLMEAFARPSEAIKFILAAFGSSVVGIDAFYACDYLSFDAIIGLGLVVIIFYILALVLYFSSKMYEGSYLPLFLIIQTFLYLGLTTFARLGLGIDYGMASRYTHVSIYGIAAVVWIFIFVLSRLEKRSLLIKSILMSGITIIFLGLILTSIIVWRFQPMQKAYFMRLHDIAMRVDTATVDELAMFGERPEQVRASLRLLREHNLNVYRNYSWGSK
jgi:hypothetical protein